MTFDFQIDLARRPVILDYVKFAQPTPMMFQADKIDLISLPKKSAAIVDTSFCANHILQYDTAMFGLVTLVTGTYEALFQCAYELHVAYDDVTITRCIFKPKLFMRAGHRITVELRVRDAHKLKELQALPHAPPVALAVEVHFLGLEIDQHRVRYIAEHPEAVAGLLIDPKELKAP